MSDCNIYLENTQSLNRIQALNQLLNKLFKMANRDYKINHLYLKKGVNYWDHLNHIAFSNNSSL